MSGSRAQRTGTILAFDFGRARIGVAVGDMHTTITGPLTTLRARGGRPDWEEVEALLAEWTPTRLLVGRPTHLDGAEDASTAAAERFARALAARSALPVELVDERLSSVEARHRLREQRRSGFRRRRVRRGDVDPLAAQLILDIWLAEGHPG